MPTVERAPLSRREIEILVAWVKSGFVIAGQESEPWAARLLAKLRASWVDARDAAEPSDNPPPRDYQVPHHQRAPIDTPRERAKTAEGASARADTRAGAGRTESDRASFRGHGIAPGDPMPGDAARCAGHVAEIHARYNASAAVMLAAVRARDAVVDWGSLVHAHVIADGECIYALNDVDGRRVLLWDPDADAEPWRAPIDRAGASAPTAPTNVAAAQGTPAAASGASASAEPRKNARERKKPPKHIGH